jgi:hypothetical protein
MKVHMDIKMSPTRIEASNLNSDEILRSLTDPKENSNDIAISAGSNLRVVAIKSSTYEETFDTIIRKCVEAYKKE